MHEEAAGNEDDLFIDIPLGSKLKIFYRAKKNGIQNVARFKLGPNKNHFYASFEEDDVDFTIGLENSNSDDRDALFELKILCRTYGFIAPMDSLPETLTSNVRKLRFIRQSSEERKKLVSTTAVRHGMDRHYASMMLSEIRCNVSQQYIRFM